MKTFRIFTLFLFTTLIISCNQDDDSNNASTNSLILGDWKFNRRVQICADGTEFINTYSTCEQNGGRAFARPNLYYGTEFEENINNDCVLFASYTGTWDIVDNVLIVNVGGNTFENNFLEITDTLLRYGSYDSNINIPCDGDQDTSHYYYEFVRE
jgi:hypothetical protein